jgi:hypothetical protein
MVDMVSNRRILSGRWLPGTTKTVGPGYNVTRVRRGEFRITVDYEQWIKIKNTI